MRASKQLLIISLLLAACGCRTNSSIQNKRLRHWGTMREVLREGKTQDRINLAEAVEQPHTYGVGALTDLLGEITIVDGKVWIARADQHGATSTKTSQPTNSATLLAVALVPHWQTVEVKSVVAPGELDAFIKKSAIKAGINPSIPFPFLITGKLSANGHIIRGSCPHAAATSMQDDKTDQPYRFTVDKTNAIAVGIYAETSEGILTHHGSKTHLHLVVGGNTPVSGHVDSMTVPIGAVLSLPVAWPE